jgi:hypothetical protein
VIGEDLSPAEREVCKDLYSGRDAADNAVHHYSGLKVNPNPTDLAYQEAITSLLGKTAPVLNTRHVDGPDDFLDRIKEKLKIPIVAVSTGETESDKLEIEKGQ